MLFPTVEFGIFFVLVFAGYWAVAGRTRLSKYFLLAASYFFYAQWDWRFVHLLFFCSLANYLSGIWIGREEDPARRKRILALAIGANLATLGFFKYYGFFVSSCLNLLSSLGFELQLPLLNIVLPVGISFFIFQAMSYVVDVYRREIEPCRFLPDVLLYVAFFPQLVAGPIVRAKHFLPQLTRRILRPDVAAPRACLLIIGGLFKKVVLAHYVAVGLVDPVFANPTAHSGLEVLLSVYGYAVQIFCDFSAYSDIAIGVAALFGFHFLDNFNQPYRADSIQDFWRRWHISLSTWLRDYLYIPLGGSRHGSWRTYRNLAIVMLLGGLWHGAAWNFVFWGGLHGSGLALERYLGRRFRHHVKRLIPRPLAIVLVFHFVCVGWVFFRAPSFTAALEWFRALANPLTTNPLVTPLVVICLLLGLALHFTPARVHPALTERFHRLPAPAQSLLLGLLLVLLSACSPEGVAPFIYFQF